MPTNHKVFTLDLQNATVENFNHWYLTNDFITANTTKDFIRYRILEQNDENPMRFIFIINDFIFGTSQKNDFRTIDIPNFIHEEFVAQCVPIKLQDVEQYRQAITNWINNNHRISPKLCARVSAYKKFKNDFNQMSQPNFTSCVSCIDVLELGYALGDFHSIFDNKFKAIYEHFRFNYEGKGLLRRVKLSRIYIMDQYIMGYTFNLEGAPEHYYTYNLNFDAMMYDYITPYTFQYKLEEIQDDKTPN